MSDLLGAVAELVERESGIQTKDSQLGALAAALGRVSPGMDAARFLAVLNDPAQRSALLGRLIDEVATQETFFMREPRELEAVDWHRLLAAAHARGDKEVTVWISACASGEEAYSVAMLAAEAFGQGVPVSILATDISERALKKAKEAVYSERSMRDVSAARCERFFTRTGRRSSPGEQLRSLVRFRRHNLVADRAQLAAEAPFDLILCRNVLIYFSADTVEAVVANLESMLRPAGQLILGASDRLTSSARRLEDIAAGLTTGELDAPARALRKAQGGRREQLRKPLGRADRSDAPIVARAAVEEASVMDALEAANRGEYPAAAEKIERVLADDPLNAEALFVRGLAEIAGGEPDSAVASLRRALYIDPSFALAAFQLGRAQDVQGEAQAARRAYRQALRTLKREDDRHETLLAGVGVEDVAAACRARLSA